MNYEPSAYLMPLFSERKEIPLGELIFRATGALCPSGGTRRRIMADIEELKSKGYIRVAGRHHPKHRRIEHTVSLTDRGRKLCEAADGPAAQDTAAGMPE